MRRGRRGARAVASGVDDVLPFLAFRDQTPDVTLVATDIGRT
jgi:hypothetical protein